MSTLLRRLIDLRRSDDEVAADELRDAATARGCTQITESTDREVVTVAGTVTAVTLRPKVTVPALVADVFTGSATVQLVWLGRRSIGGINPGAYVKATGLVCRPKGTPVMYNPAYEILPGHGG